MSGSGGVDACVDKVSSGWRIDRSASYFHMMASWSFLLTRLEPLKQPPKTPAFDIKIIYLLLMFPPFTHRLYPLHQYQDYLQSGKGENDFVVGEFT